MIQIDQSFRIARKMFASFCFLLQNDDGTPAVIDGQGVRMQIRQNPHSNPVVTMGTGLGNAGTGDGGYVATWIPADADWPRAGRYKYDVVLFPDGIPQMGELIASGSIEIYETVTKL